MASVKGGLLSKQNNHPVSVSGVLNNVLDSEGFRRRFNELLGARAPQFISSILSLVNANKQLQAIARNNPISVIQACLKAAVFNLPIDPGLGFAYIIPFGNEATFIMGYKGLIQLAIRTGMYAKINAVDVREGEMKYYNRLTEEMDFEFIADEEERKKTPVVGYCAYFKLTSGYEKCIYMSVKEIQLHEQRFRKGKFMSPIWRDDFHSMALKTVLRRLLTKWGILSIDYQKTSAKSAAIAEDIASGKFDDEQVVEHIEDVPQNVDMETGEIKEPTKESEQQAEEKEQPTLEQSAADEPQVDKKGSKK